MNRRRPIATTCLRAALALTLASSPAWAQPDLESVLDSLIAEAPSGSPVTPLDETARLLLREARDALRVGAYERAWDRLREARALLNADHQDIFITGAEVAAAQGDRLRGAILRRRALDLEPTNDDNREALARLIVLGVPHAPSDVWVLARTLSDPDAALSDEQRALMLRALGGRLKESGRDEAAGVVNDRAGVLAERVGVPAILGESIVSKADTERKATITSTLEHIEADPLRLDEVANELLRSERNAALLIERFEEIERTPESAALLAWLLCESNRANSGDGVLRTQLIDHPGHPALLTARARTLRLKGDYDLLRRLGTAQGTENPASLELGAMLLHAGAGDEVARDRIRRSLELTDPSERDLYVRRALLAASIARALDDAQGASEVLLAAHRTAPDDARPLRELVELHAPEGDAPNTELHTLAASRLLALEDNHAAGVLRATAALRRGYADIAEGLLLDLAEERPDDPLPTRALVELWLDTERAHEAQQWLSGWLEKRPGLSHMRVLLSDVFLHRGRVRYAVETLEEWYDNNPGDMTVALQLEYVYREHTQARQQAEHLQLKRLRRFPESVDRLKDRVLILARIGDPRDIERELDLLLPQLREGEHDLDAWSVEVFQRLYQLSLRRRAGQVDVTPIVARLHAELPSTPLQSDLLAIRALGSAHRDTNATVDAVRRAMARHEEQAAELAMIGAEELVNDAASVANLIRSEERGDDDEVRQITRERIDAGFDLARRSIDSAFERGVPAYEGPGKESALLYARSVQLMVRSLKEGASIGEHGRAILDAFLALEDPLPGLYAMQTPRSLDDAALRATISDELLAATAHFLAGVVPDGREGDDRRADALSEMALRIDGTSVEIKNDFGYRLAERGVRLNDAETMIEAAVLAEPDNHSYVDSLGWVRYTMGVIEDTPDREGAVTLLERAVRLAAGKGDARMSLPTLHDHLGDALWRAGLEDDALEHWKASERAGTNLLIDLSIDVREPREAADVRYLRFYDQHVGVVAKIKAVDEGLAPGVSPIP